VFFLLGGGYTMVHKRHVRIDLLYSMLPKRGQAIYELFFFIVMFLPTMAVIGLRSVDYAAAAWETGQSLSTTVWTFPAAPIRTVIPIAFFLLFMQGIAEVLRNILILTGKERNDD
jgi:TRAP-type mannitol/chloroaromatic compound transport system permease small subunit